MGCVQPSSSSAAAAQAASSAKTSAANPVHDNEGSKGHINSVLFFPDVAMPCRFGSKCRRKTCAFSHEQTSLTRFLKGIDSAKATFDVCVFTITCNEIAAGIIALHKRGVRVRIITDDEQTNAAGSDVGKFIDAGIRVRHDDSPHHMHHKFAVLDGRILLTGSFNWTRSAVLHNKENILITDHPSLVSAYAREFENLWLEFRASGRGRKL